MTGPYYLPDSDVLVTRDRETAALGYMGQAECDLTLARREPADRIAHLDAAIDKLLQARVLLTCDEPAADGPPAPDAGRLLADAVRLADAAHSLTTVRLEHALRVHVSHVVRTVYPTAARLRVQWYGHTSMLLCVFGARSGRAAAPLLAHRDVTPVGEDEKENIHTLDWKITGELTRLGQLRPGDYPEFVDLIPATSDAPAVSGA
jgi:hypothetical protein